MLATTAWPHASPALVATPTRDHANGQMRATGSTCFADAYITAASFELNDDPLAWTTADRALQAAHAGDDPLTVAEARLAVATVLRRTGRPAQASDLLLSAARAIEPGHRPIPSQLSMYVTLLGSPPTPQPSTVTITPPQNTSARPPPPPGSVRFGSVRLGSARLGSARLGSARLRC
jgi:hypothetical protein